VLPGSIAFAANHGAVAGGEQMLLTMAEATRDQGVATLVVGPPAPPDLASAVSRLQLRFEESRAGSQAARYRDTRRTLRRLDCDLVWCNGPFPGLAALGMRAPWVLHLHQPPSRLQAPPVRWMRAAALSTIAPSHSMARELPGSAVLWNWTSEARGRVQPPEDEVFRIGFLGRLSPIKGVTVLARAVEILQSEGTGRIELLLGGDTRFVPRGLREEVQRSLGRIADVCEPLGWVPAHEVFSRASVVAVPSVWDEPFGLVAAESMAARVPVVVSDAGALPEVVGEEHPWVSRRGSAEDLARVLTQVRDEPDACRRSVAAARQRWEDLFSPGAGRQRFLGVLASVFERAGRD